MSKAAIYEGAEASPPPPPSSSSFVALPAARRTHSFTRSVAGFGVAPNFDSTENGSDARSSGERDRTAINIDCRERERDEERARGAEDGSGRRVRRPRLRPSVRRSHRLT